MSNKYSIISISPLLHNLLKPSTKLKSISLVDVLNVNKNLIKFILSLKHAQLKPLPILIDGFSSKRYLTKYIF